MLSLSDEIIIPKINEMTISQVYSIKTDGQYYEKIRWRRFTPKRLVLHFGDIKTNSMRFTMVYKTQEDQLYYGKMRISLQQKNQKKSF